MRRVQATGAREASRPSRSVVRAAARGGKPQAGICFGHQLMAQAFGGKVEKSEKGWGVGVHLYHVHEAAPFMAPLKQEIACAVSHQDQVVAPPEGARVLAGSRFCPNGALAYAQGPAVSFQMHPEFGHDFAGDLLNARSDRIPEGVAETALESLKGSSDRDLLGEWVVNFFNQRIA